MPVFRGSQVISECVALAAAALRVDRGSNHQLASAAKLLASGIPFLIDSADSGHIRDRLTARGGSGARPACEA